VAFHAERRRVLLDARDLRERLRMAAELQHHEQLHRPVPNLRVADLADHLVGT